MSSGSAFSTIPCFLLTVSNKVGNNPKHHSLNFSMYSWKVDDAIGGTMRRLKYTTDMDAILGVWGAPQKMAGFINTLIYDFTVLGVDTITIYDAKCDCSIRV